MIVLDVNVLVAAYLAGHPFHAAARRFLRRSLEIGGVAVPDVVWSGFARTATNPAIAKPPATWAQVRAFADAIRAHPGYRQEVRGMVTPVEQFFAIAEAAGASGNRVSDAYIAAVALDYNAAVATWDRDFESLPARRVAPDR